MQVTLVPSVSCCARRRARYRGKHRARYQQRRLLTDHRHILISGHHGYHEDGLNCFRRLLFRCCSVCYRWSNESQRKRIQIPLEIMSIINGKRLGFRDLRRLVASWKVYVSNGLLGIKLDLLSLGKSTSMNFPLRTFR